MNTVIDSMSSYVSKQVKIMTKVNGGKYRVYEYYFNSNDNKT